MTPTLKAAYEIDSTGADTSTLTTPSFTPTTGEVILIKAVTAGSDLVPGSASGGSQTYTSRASSAVSNTAAAALITAVVSGTPGSMTVSVPFTGSAEFHSIVVERWGNVQLAATPAVNGTKTGTGAPSTAIDTVANDSVVSWCNGDWNAVSPSTATYRSSAIQDGLHNVSPSAYVAYYAYQAAATAGAQTIGLSAPSGQKWTMLGIELQAGTGGGGGGTDGALSGTAATAHAAAVAGAFGGSTPPPDIPDPIAAYSFDSGTAVDDSGNGRAGTVVGTGVTFGTGHTSGGITSTGGSDTYVSIPRDGLEPAEAITVMGWFISGATSQHAFASALAKSRTNDGDSFNLLLSLTGGKVGLEYSIGSADGTDLLSTTDIRSDGTWHHLAGTYDGTTVTLYIDGEVAGTSAASGSIIYDTTANWAVLGSDAWPSEGVVGSADDIRIFDQALSQSDIQSLMDTPVTAGTSNQAIHGVAATATSAAIGGSFELGSTFTGEPPTASAGAIPGVFASFKDGSLSGATATANAEAIAGDISAATNGVMVGAIAAAAAASVPGAFSANSNGTLAGALATAMTTAIEGVFAVNASFAGAAASATSRAVGGSFAGHLAHTALIVTAITGPFISAAVTGPGLQPEPVVTGPTINLSATGPAIAGTVTGPET